MKLLAQLGVIILAKLTVMLLVAFLATLMIPYLGNFSFPEVLAAYNLPVWIKALANFDGVHYLNIAQHGYYQFGHAFFPLYPLLIKLLGWLTLGNHLLAAVLISQLALVGAAWLAYHWLKSVWSDEPAKWFLIFWLSFPTAFFLQAAYTESLFLLLVFACFWQLKQQKYWWAGGLGFLAALTRVTGVFLLIPILGYQLSNWKKSSILAGLLPVMGLGVYLLFLKFTTGDALAFFHAQSAFGAGRSTDLILLPQVYFRYGKILWAATFNFGYGVAVLELTIFTFAWMTASWETWKSFQLKNLPLLSVGLFSLAILLLPTLTGTLLSTPRFALAAVSSFIWLARIKSSAAKFLIVIIFGSLQLMLWTYFARGYFIS